MRATVRLLPKTARMVPLHQNGKGSQLVPLGSRRGAWANDCAIVTRA